MGRYRYERLFCAHIEETRITLYQITKTSVGKVSALALRVKKRTNANSHKTCFRNLRTTESHDRAVRAAASAPTADSLRGQPVGPPQHRGQDDHPVRHTPNPLCRRGPRRAAHRRRAQHSAVRLRRKIPVALYVPAHLVCGGACACAMVRVR